MGRTKSTKCTGEPKTKTRKSKPPVVEPKVNEISFINEKISKQLKFTAIYNGGQYIDFAMNLKEIDGTQVHCRLPVKDVLATLKYNYNIGIISFSKGVYSYQFDRAQFEAFLRDNELY